MKKITLSSANYHHSLKLAAQSIQKGELVIFPSDTVYILAVDPQNPSAVTKLLSFKDRWFGKAISCAVCNIAMAREYVNLDDNTSKLYQNLLPGPFTIVSAGKHLMAPGIEAENGTLGIRIPDSKPILDLLNLLKSPITATSANLSGRTPHYSVASFLKTLSLKKKNQIDLIIDAGPLPKRLPSTVIDATGNSLRVLRRGDLVTANSQSFISDSVSQTQKIAQFIYSKVTSTSDLRPLVFTLSGDLGCGKTIFAKSIGKIIGITEVITSPTFFIYNQYPVSNPRFSQFFHFDLYRLTAPSEFEEIKFLSHFKSNTIHCLEWPEMMPKKYLSWLKKNTNYVSINFQYLSAHRRQLDFSHL